MLHMGLGWGQPQAQQIAPLSPVEASYPKGPRKLNLHTPGQIVHSEIFVRPGERAQGFTTELEVNRQPILPEDFGSVELIEGGP